MRILVTMPLNERQKARLVQEAPDAEFIFHVKSEVTKEDLAGADIILGNLSDPKQLLFAENLKWIQLNNAGTEGYCDPQTLPPDVLLTNATGAYGLAISEHMIGCLFMLRKKLHLYYADQMEENWKREGHVAVVEGSRVLSVGMGDIGSTFLRKMKGLGAVTVGIKRTPGEKPSYVDELWTPEALERELSLADIVALSLPGNDTTRHMLNRSRLSLMKENAVLLNVGRGSAVDTVPVCGQDRRSRPGRHGPGAAACRTSALESAERDYHPARFRRIFTSRDTGADCGNLRGQSGKISAGRTAEKSG